MPTYEALTSGDLKLHIQSLAARHVKQPFEKVAPRCPSSNMLERGATVQRLGLLSGVVEIVAHVIRKYAINQH